MNKGGTEKHGIEQERKETRKKNHKVKYLPCQMA